jgi:serine/threonine protein phosphatase PrpC
MNITHYSEQGERDSNHDRAIIAESGQMTLLGVLDGLGRNPEEFLNDFSFRISEIFKKSQSDSAESELLLSMISETVRGIALGRACYALVVNTPRNLIMAHGGDCRIYLPSRKYVTQDCSYPGRCSNSQSHEYIAAHPYSGYVENVASEKGVSNGVQVQQHLKDNENVIICTDGFWRNLNESCILGLRHDSLKTTVKKAINKPLVNSDNATALIATAHLMLA